jgi:hypothetical protein
MINVLCYPHNNRTRKGFRLCPVIDFMVIHIGKILSICVIIWHTAKQKFLIKDHENPSHK